MNRGKLIAGNWKMNMDQKSCKDFVYEFSKVFTGKTDNNTLLICPPSILVQTLSESISSNGLEETIKVGLQNIHWLENGAHTGEISIPMTKSFNVKYSILGHSERREFYGESSENVAKKAKTCLENGIRPIVCVGEDLNTFNKKMGVEFVCKQVESSLSSITSEEAENGLVIAYEPIWAIGSGLAATSEIISEIHKSIRKKLAEIFSKDLSDKIHILYGGSLKPENAKEILALKDVDGGLIGGASLKVSDFLDIFKACP